MEFVMYRRLTAALLLFCIGISAALAQSMPLRIGYQTAEVNVLLTYAIKAGLFDKQKLKVTLMPFPAGPAMLPALASNEIDMAWMGEFPSVTGYSNGLPIEILMMERLDFTNIRLVVNPATGAKSVKDLKGKKIGASVGSSSHYHLLNALAQAGLSQGDVTVVNLPPANMPAAYVAGQIDAAFTWEPNIGIIEKNGGTVLATTKSLGMITGGVWVAQNALSQEKPETLQAFLRAWREAQRDYLANPKNVRQYEATRIGQTPDEFDALIARQTASNPSFEQLITADFMGAPGKELDSRLMKHLQGIAAFLVSEKRIKEVPKEWTKLFNTAPLLKTMAAEKK
jgi:aliphatic sulfonates family ABC transporter substrate-binding protein